MTSRVPYNVGDCLVWMDYGVRHREDGPAVLYRNGNEEWWLDGERHRVGGPAISYSCGYRKWIVQDKLHCTCGPAVIHTCGSLHVDGACIGNPLSHPLGPRIIWYANGRRFTEREFNLYVDQITGEVLVPPGKRLQNDP